MGGCGRPVPRCAAACLCHREHKGVQVNQCTEAARVPREVGAVEWVQAGSRWCGFLHHLLRKPCGKKRYISTVLAHTNYTGNMEKIPLQMCVRVGSRHGGMKRSIYFGTEVCVVVLLVIATSNFPYAALPSICRCLGLFSVATKQDAWAMNYVTAASPGHLLPY